MKYFLHDSNAFNDEKITELFMKFGYEGIGLFFTILEKISAQEKPIKTSVLKKQLFVGKKLEKCWKFMEEIDLISSSNGETFNKQLLKFSEKYQIKKEKNKERISQWRENQQDEKNVTRYESVGNAPKVKVSKGIVKEKNNIKEENSIFKLVDSELSELTVDQRTKWDKFQTWLTTQNLSELAKIEKQLSPKELMQLTEKYNFSMEEVALKIIALNNHKNCQKKYNTVYHTILVWLKSNRQAS